MPSIFRNLKNDEDDEEKKQKSFTEKLREEGSARSGSSSGFTGRAPSASKPVNEVKPVGTTQRSTPFRKPVNEVPTKQTLDVAWENAQDRVHNATNSPWERQQAANGLLGAAVAAADRERMEREKQQRYLRNTIPGYSVMTPDAQDKAAGDLAKASTFAPMNPRDRFQMDLNNAARRAAVENTRSYLNRAIPGYSVMTPAGQAEAAQKHFEDTLPKVANSYESNPLRRDEVADRVKGLNWEERARNAYNAAPSEIKGEWNSYWNNEYLSKRARYENEPEFKQYYDGKRALTEDEIWEHPTVGDQYKSDEDVAVYNYVRNKYGWEAAHDLYALHYKRNDAVPESGAVDSARTYPTTDYHNADYLGRRAAYESEPEFKQYYDGKRPLTEDEIAQHAIRDSVGDEEDVAVYNYVLQKYGQDAANDLYALHENRQNRDEVIANARTYERRKRYEWLNLLAENGADMPAGIDPEEEAYFRTRAIESGSGFYSTAPQASYKVSDNPTTQNLLNRINVDSRREISNFVENPDLGTRIWNAMGGDLANNAYTGDPTLYMTTITDDEKRTLNYLADSGQIEKLDEYAEALDLALQQRWTNQSAQTIAWFAQQAPGVASAISALQSLNRGATFVAQGLDYLTSGSVNEYAPYNQYSRIPDTIRSTVTKDVEEKYGKPGSFLYQTGMSMADFVVTMLAGQSLGLGSAEAAEKVTLSLMSSGAGASKVIEAKERGLSDGQSYALGLIAAFAEYVTEKVSLDVLLNPEMMHDDLIKYIGLNSLVEGSEEINSDIINTFGDLLFSADKAELRQNIARYQRDYNVSEGEAFGLAMGDLTGDMFLSGAAGTLSGLGMSGGMATLSSMADFYDRSHTPVSTGYNEATPGRSNLDLAAMEYLREQETNALRRNYVQEIAANPENTEARVEFERANRRVENRYRPFIEKSIETYVDTVDADVRRGAVDDAVSAESNLPEEARNYIRESFEEMDRQSDPDQYVQDMGTAFRVGRTGQTLGYYLENKIISSSTPVENLQQMYRLGRRVATIDSAETKRAQLETIQNSDEGKRIGDLGIRTVSDIKTFEEAISDFGMDTIEKVSAYKEAGFTADDVRNALNTGEIKVFAPGGFKDGGMVFLSEDEANMSAADLGVGVEERVVPTSDVAWVSALQGQYTGGEYGGQRNVSLHDGGERLALQSTGERGGRVAEGTGSSSEGGDYQFRPKDRAVLDQTPNGEETNAVRLGIQGGNENTTVRIWNADYTPAMEKAESLFQRRGVKTVFFYGANLSVAGGNGNVRGLYDPVSRTAYIRVDHPQYDSYTLAKHEVFHDIIAQENRVDRRENIDNMWDAFTRDVGTEIADETIKLYKAGYPHLFKGRSEEDAMYDLKEEILADMYAGLNIFADTGRQESFDEIISMASGFRDLVDGLSTESDVNPEARAVIDGEDYRKNVRFSSDVSDFDAKFETMSDGRIRPRDLDSLSDEDWKTIYKAVKRLGYGLQSAEQARQIYSRYVGENGFNAEQSGAIKNAYGASKANEFVPNTTREALARKTFGTTGDFREAGYLMRNGSMLDFSGKKDGGPAHVRYMDHREIYSVFSDGEIADSKKRYGDATAYMNAFIDEGNIRLMYGQGVTIGEVEPTAAQYAVLKRFIDQSLDAHDYFYLDLSNSDGHTIESRDYYPADGADRVIRDIKAYFKSGELPYKSGLSQFRFSLEPVQAELENYGADVVDGEAVVKMSEETWSKTDKKKLIRTLTSEKGGGFALDVVERWIDMVNDVSSIIAADRNRLDYKAADNQVMLKKNAEYIKTLDASTLCAKRLLYQGTFNRITELLPDSVLSDEDIVHLRALMSEKGDTVPCGACYVESRRKFLSTFAGRWLNEVYKGDVKIDMHDLTSTDGLEALRASHRDIYEDYTRWMRQRGVANPKIVELRTSYRGEILKLTKRTIDKIVRIGGLRIQSFSDFETVHLIDMMQAVLDMAAKKLTAQAYTKVPNFAWAFGDTGIKINLSLMGQAVNGELVFDSKEGMDINEAMKLRERYSKNVGTILVGANRESILLAMADNRVDQIIPFHRSGWSKEQFEELGLVGYEDFQDEQNERRLDGTGLPKEQGNLYPPDYWDYSLSGKENAQRYLDICAMKAPLNDGTYLPEKRIPKFDSFLVDNGDGSWSLQADGSTDGYWKTLTDYKMYDNDGVGAKQVAVEPNFNMDECRRILKEYDGVGNGSLPVDEVAAKAYVNWYKKTHNVKASEERADVPEDIASEIESLRDELKKQTERAEYFKGQTRLTNPRPQVTDASILKLTKSFINGYASNVDANEAQHAIKNYANWVRQNVNKVEGDRYIDFENEAMDRAVEIVRPIIKDATAVVNQDMVDIGKDIKAYLRGGHGISLSEADKRGVVSLGYDSFADFRKRNFGRLKITNDGPRVDQVWTELQDQYGKNFFPDDIMNTLEQLERINEVLTELEPIYDNPWKYSGLDVEDAIDTAAGELFRRVLSDEVKEVAPTFSDKMHDRIEEEHRRGVEKVREAEQRVRENRENRIKRLKEHFKDVNKTRIDLRNAAIDRQRLLKIARRVSRMNAPLETKALIQEHVGNLDLVAQSLTKKKRLSLYDLKEWYDEYSKTKDFIPIDWIEKELARLSKQQMGTAREAADAARKGLYFDGMTQEDVLSLTKILLNIEHELRTSRKTINTQDQRDVFAQAQDVATDIANTRGRQFFKDSKTRTFLIDNTLSPRSFFRRVTGYVDSDPLYQRFLDLNEGQRKMYTYKMKAQNLFKDWMGNKEFRDTIIGKNAKLVTGTFGGQKVTMTRGQLIDLYMNTLNDDNLRHVAYGGVMFPDAEELRKGKLEAAYRDAEKVRITPSEAREFFANEGKLTKDELAFVRAMQSYFSGMSHDEINRVCLDLYGYERATVEDYYPISVDKRFLNTQDFAQLYDVSKDSGEITMRPGFLEERIHAATPIMSRLVTDVLDSSIDKTAKFVGMAIPVRNFSKLYSAQGFDYEDAVTPPGKKKAVRSVNEWNLRAVIEQKWTKAATDYIENLMRDIRGKTYSNDPGEAFLRAVRSNYAQAVLTLNASVALKQAASWTTAAAVVGWEPIRKAMGLSTEQLGKVDADLIARYTPLYWIRTEGLSDVERGDMKNAGKHIPKALNWIQDVDLLVTRRLWRAAEFYVRKNNPALAIGGTVDAYYQEVASVYNEIIERTQPNYTVLQRPANLRGGFASQILNMFKTQPYQNANILYDAVGNYLAKRRQNTIYGTEETKAALKKARKELFNATSAVVVSAGVFAAMTVAWATGRRKDEDEEARVADFWKGVASTFTGMMPLGSELFELVYALSTGNRYWGYEDVVTSVFGDLLESVYDFGDAIGKGITEGKRVKAAKVLGLARYISQAIGFPLTNVLNLMNIGFAWAGKGSLTDFIDDQIPPNDPTYVYERRKALGMTTKELAEACGVSETTVKNWESQGIPNIKKSTREKLADALGVSINTIDKAIGK